MASTWNQSIASWLCVSGLLGYNMLSYEILDKICDANGYSLICYSPLELEDSCGYIIRGNTAKSIVADLEKSYNKTKRMDKYMKDTKDDYTTALKSSERLDSYFMNKKLYKQGDLFEEEIPKPSCLDSAYERKAIDDGVNNNPVFPENIIYLAHKVRE